MSMVCTKKKEIPIAVVEELENVVESKFVYDVDGN